MEAIELSNQLRSGNLINYMGKPIKCSVSTIFAVSKCVGDSFLYQPILLDNEWLLKFGFVHDDDYMELSIDKDFSIIWVGYLGIIINGSINFLSNKCYVHDLQNLYFALKGEELQGVLF